MAFNPLAAFLQEAEELLADIEQSALSLASEAAPAETVNRLFRAFHTIKGSGAMCGLDRVAAFTHHIESLLDAVREGAVPVSERLVELILQARDHIQFLLNSAQSGEGVPPGAGEQLIAAIAGLAKQPAAASKPAPDAPAGAVDGPAADRGETEREWHIRFHPHAAALANGWNPASLLADLRGLGTCTVAAHSAGVPALDALQPDRCYLWWSAELRSSCGEDAIRDVFLFVEDDGKLEIAARQETAVEDSPAPTVPAARPAEPVPQPEGAPSRPQPPAKEVTVRVPAERLDRLVRLVGELVMNQSCLAQAASQTAAAEFVNPVQALERLVAELRDNVLGIRMLPIGSLFGRFRRLVHDLSLELGKEAELLTEGAETELDKSILDQLGEPLVHCLRNCLDHGVETPSERLEKGKPRRAIVRLAAEHTGPNVVIRIQDDGRGIDRRAVRAKAIERQLIAANAVLSDQEILNLLVLPGFSTARQITSVSGRGVGMDAVKRQVDALRGSLSLASREGQGTQISITLPLTLAIIDGLLVRIGGDPFIIPMAAVTENVELMAADRRRNNGRNVIAVRGELIPYIDLRGTFGLGGEAPPIEKVVIVQREEGRVGLVVDGVVGTHQTVIQSLGKLYRGIEVVSGATIMGDGRVALILDLAAVVRHADAQCRAD